jgi:hypothetical protein
MEHEVVVKADHGGHIMNQHSTSTVSDFARRRRCEEDVLVVPLNPASNAGGVVSSNKIIVVVPHGSCTNEVKASVEMVTNNAVAIQVLASHPSPSRPQYHDCISLELAARASSVPDDVRGQLLHLAVDMITASCGAGPFTISVSGMTAAQRLLFFPFRSEAITPHDLGCVLAKVCCSELRRSETIDVLAVDLAGPSGASLLPSDADTVDIVFAFRGLKGRSLSERAQELVGVVCEAFDNIVELDTKHAGPAALSDLTQAAASLAVHILVSGERSVAMGMKASIDALAEFDNIIRSKCE